MLRVDHHSCLLLAHCLIPTSIPHGKASVWFRYHCRDGVSLPQSRVYIDCDPDSAVSGYGYSVCMNGSWFPTLGTCEGKY